MRPLRLFLAHNLSREIQMIAQPLAPRSLVKRPALYAFERLDTLRHRIIQRAGRLTRPQGELTLTMSANQAVRSDLMQFLGYIRNSQQEDVFEKQANGTISRSF
jgi:hypothetical protein